MNEAPNYQNALTDPLVFTTAAAHKVRELITEENNPNLKLRVYISGGGCSGRADYSSLDGLRVRREEAGRVHRDRYNRTARRLRSL